MKPREEGEESEDEDEAGRPRSEAPDTQNVARKPDEQNHSASVTEKRRRQNGERSTRHDDRGPAEKRRRDEHSSRDDREKDHRRDRSSRHEREKDRDRGRGMGGERAHVDREHRRDRESDRDRRENRAAGYRSYKRGEADRGRDASRPDRYERSAGHSRGSEMKEAGPSSRDRRNPKDAEREVAEDAGGAPSTEHQNGHSSIRPAEEEAVQARAAPKSLEEVLHRKQEAEQEAAKPKFLSRKEREQAALERWEKSQDFHLKCI